MKKGNTEEDGKREHNKPAVEGRGFKFRCTAVPPSLQRGPWTPQAPAGSRHMPTSMLRGRHQQLLPHPQSPKADPTRPSAAVRVRGKHALSNRRAAALGIEEVKPHRQRRARPAPAGSQPARLRGEPGRGLAQGTVGKAAARPGRTGCGPSERSGGVGGRCRFRLTWRWARNPGPVSTRS